jgi:hypothetical protein
VTTYAASGSSRAWEADKPYVVTLDVPEDVTPVKFCLAIERRHSIADAAHAKTLAHLGHALRSIA